MAKIDAAVSLGKTVRVRYRTDTSTTCANLPSYGSAPAPLYVMII